MTSEPARSEHSHQLGLFHRQGLDTRRRYRIAIATLMVLSVGGGLATEAVAQSPELTEQALRQLDEQEAVRLDDLRNHPERRLPRRMAAVHSMCGNGDLETRLDATEWIGGHGRTSTAGDPGFANFTAGLLDGPPKRDTSHQTWVARKDDDEVSALAQVAPVGLQGPGSFSAGAVRLGNSAAGRGSELLSKTFTVTQSQDVLRFWYAVVLQNPLGHAPHAQPSFWVRVLDATGQPIQGLVNLGSGSDQLVADRDNPFFQRGPRNIVFRDWSCAEIDLSSLVGQTVTVQWITEDCAQGAHFGYAYLDNICGTCTGDPSGSTSLAASASDDCGLGQVCFDYTLPSAGDLIGEATITLEWLHDGAVVGAMDSPLLTEGSRYCFSVDRAVLGSLPRGAQGFDIRATTDFSIAGVDLASKSVGTAASGIRPGTDNDYRTSCVCDQICCLAPCCVDGGCIETTVDYCRTAGGIADPDSETCDLGRCRLGDLCFPTSRSLCASEDGEWLGDQPCPAVIDL